MESKDAFIKQLKIETIEQAMDYYDEYGWCLIPVYPKSKLPVVKWGQYQIERPDREITMDFFKGGIRNIAVVVGAVSNGLTCRDFDTRWEYRQWREAHPEWAKTLPTVRTSRGYHVYFRSDAQGCKTIRNGELRGSGCICLLPNSIHKSGVRYEWFIRPNGEIPVVDDYQTVCAIQEVSHEEE